MWVWFHCIPQTFWAEHRFSAFWLRSKCSICSYQLNIWYGGHVPPSILNWFLQGDEVQELAPASSRVGLALQYRQDRPTSPLTPEDHQLIIVSIALQPKATPSQKQDPLKPQKYWIHWILMNLWQNPKQQFERNSEEGFGYLERAFEQQNKSSGMQMILFSCQVWSKWPHLYFIPSTTWAVQIWIIWLISIVSFSNE